MIEQQEHIQLLGEPRPAGKQQEPLWAWIEQDTQSAAGLALRLRTHNPLAPDDGLTTSQHHPADACAMAESYFFCHPDQLTTRIWTPEPDAVTSLA